MDKGGVRFLLYSHDGMGLGHLRRNLAIAKAIADFEPKASILLTTGVDEFSHLGLPRNIDILKLPGLCKVSNMRYGSRHLEIPSDHILAIRSALLTTAIQQFQPSVMLVDKHPLGANGELRRALDVLKERGGRTVIGFRAILDDRDAVLKEWVTHRISESILKFYDRVLIYGDRKVFDSINEYGFPASIAEKTSFCGYVVNQLEMGGSEEYKLPLLSINHHKSPIVLATAGGGEDGFSILETFIKAARGESWRGIVVTGPMIPDDKREILLKDATEAGVSFYVSVPHIAEWFGKVDALVCMGGYNTIAEAVSRGTPTVCIPRTYPRTEQLIRARAFKNLGLIQLLEPERLHIHSLRQEVNAALRLSRQELMKQANDIIDFDGARKTAEYILDLATSMGKPIRRPSGEPFRDRELMLFESSGDDEMCVSTSNVVKRMVQEAW